MCASLYFPHLLQVSEWRLCKFGEDGRAAQSSPTSQGSAESLCAKIKGANREVSEEKVDL